MKNKKALFFGICAVVLMLALTTLCAAGASAESGIWGDLSWNLSDSGLLTITGAGRMDDIPYVFEEGYLGPGFYAWREYLNRITRVVIGEGITSVCDGAFRDCSALKSVSFPDSLISLEGPAFKACTALTSVRIPRNVAEISEYAFEDCTRLAALHVADGNTVYSSVDGVLLNRDQTVLIFCPIGRKSRQYTVPSSVKVIGHKAFLGCSRLTGITLPNGLTTIEYDAFRDCVNLTGITLPDSVKVLAAGAFMGCRSLKELTIPSGVEALTASLLADCTGLKHVTIKEGPVSIQGNCFSGCGSLAWIAIPKSVIGIYHKAFKDVTSLRNVYYAGSKEYMDEMLVIGGENEGLLNARWYYGATRPPVSIAGAKIAAVGNQVYTGKKIRPSVKVTCKGTDLTEGTDYTVTFKNNQEVGVATVVVKGIGNYKGKAETTFKIVPQAVKILSLKAGKQQLTVRWETNAQADGYEIEYSLKKDFTDSKKVKINKASVAEKVLGKLEAGKKYYIRIRAWKKADGKKYYSAWSPVKSKKTK